MADRIRPEQTAEWIVPVDREDEIWTKKLLPVFLGRKNTPAHIFHLERERILDRRLNTSGRFPGDQDYEHFQSEASKSSTRVGDHGRGWLGYKKWQYELLPVKKAIVEDLRMASTMGHDVLKCCLKRVKLKVLYGVGSYGMYRGCGLGRPADPEDDDDLQPRVPTFNGEKSYFVNGKRLEDIPARPVNVNLFYHMEGEAVSDPNIEDMPLGKEEELNNTVEESWI